MEKLSSMSINELLSGEFKCDCGRIHSSSVKGCNISAGALNTLPDVLAKYGVRSTYIVCDSNTYKAAAERICGILDGTDIKYDVHIFTRPGKLEPDEAAVGEAVMDYKCQDAVIGVGGGVINDICKFLKKLTGKPYIICGTAPSMDGYASDSSSMLYRGVKTTVYTCTPDEIICDLDVLKNAPGDMLLAGIGDMAAKLISICEWRISSLITGEYYCEQIADIMRKYATVCCENAEKAVQRDAEALKTVAEGLVCAGIAMNFANNSRPASGIEHYYSHLWEMRAIEEGRDSKLHGISVGVATLIAIEKYGMLKTLTPDREKACAFLKSFDRDGWERSVKEYFGRTGEAIISIENRENKYSLENCEKRLDKIVEKWYKVMEIVNKELPAYEYIFGIFEKIGFPTSPEQIGESAESAKLAYIHTRDIRDKYILSRLTYDLGLDGEVNT